MDSKVIKMNKEKIYKIISIIIIIVLILLNLKSCQNKKQVQIDYTNTINALSDTLNSYKTKDGTQVSKIQLIQTEKLNDFLKINSKDSIIQQLQKEVQKNKKKIGKTGSVIIIGNTTNVDYSDSTSISMRDTVTKNDTVYLYPEYSSLIKLGKRLNTNSDYWVSGKIKSNKDSTNLDILISNNYTVVIGQERKKGFKNLFKPKIPFVEITNENPFTETKTLRAYQVKYPKPKRLGIGFQVGYGLILDKKPIFKPYIGIGLNYNIIQIL